MTENPNAEAFLGSVAPTEGAPAQASPEADSQPAAPEPSVSEESISNFATEVASAMTAAPAPRRWEDEAMGKLTAKGWPEAVARQMVNQGGRANVESILADSDANPYPAAVNPVAYPEGGGTGAGPNGALAGAVEGGETPESADPEVAQLRATVQRMQADALVPRLSSARQELLGMYPELNDQAAWDALTPKVLGALQSGFAQDPVEALKGAVQFTYGARVQGQTAQTPNGSTDPTPGRAGQPTPGERAADADAARKRIAQLIFDGRPASEVDAIRRDYETRLGVKLGSAS